jgi:hypothetical protein
VQALLGEMEALGSAARAAARRRAGAEAEEARRRSHRCRWDFRKARGIRDSRLKRFFAIFFLCEFERLFSLQIKNSKIHEIYNKKPYF